MHPDGMGWSWRQLQETPLYVQRVCWDLLQIKRQAAAEAMEKKNKNRGADRRGA